MTLQELLWNDPEFIQERLDEQEQYLYNLSFKRPELTKERREELTRSALAVLVRLEAQYYQLQKK